MGFFANPPGPGGADFAALGGQGISLVSYSQNQEEAMKFLEWLVKDETQKKWAELGGYTAAAAILKSEAPAIRPNNRHDRTGEEIVLLPGLPSIGRSGL
jgi:ABC-type glycerol-3-phosphate transport system substrate-binding protein